jgi:hypothetical protein
MDEDVRDAPRMMRGLAWAAAGLLVAGLLSVGAVQSDNTAADERIVAAAGQGGAGVDVATTVAPPPPATAPPPATTAPPPATTVPRPTTTRAPGTTTTTRPPVAATTSTTAASSAGRAMVTLVNEHTYAFVITVNGRTFELAPGQQVGPVDLALYAHGNDIVEVRAVADPTCGLGDADNYFDPGGRYRMAIVAGPGMCRDMPGPQLKVTAA